MIEYNCRMGDPETEVVIPACKTTWWNFYLCCPRPPGRYGRIHRSSCSRHRCSRQRRLPGEYKGLPIKGLDQEALEGCMIFQAEQRTIMERSSPTGGRVLAVTAFGEDIREASELSQYMIEQLHFDDMYYRSDIGFEFRGQ